MRRRVRRSTLAALGLFLVILVGAALFLHWRNAWVAERVAGLVTRNLLSERGYSLRLEGIEGRLPGELTLKRVRVRYTGEGHEPFDLFRARRLDISFAPGSLLRGDFLSSDLAVSGAELRAFKVEGEGWVYPGFDTEQGGRSEVTVAFDRVLLDSLLVIRETPAGRDSLAFLDAQLRVFRNAAGTAVDLDRLHLTRSGAPSLDLSGRFFLREGGLLTLADVELGLPESRLGLRGNLHMAGGLRANLDLEAQPARLREIAAALGGELDTDSYLRGALQLTGHPDSLGLAGRVSGNLYDFELVDMDCRGVYTDGRLVFDLARGQLNGSSVAGNARFTLPLDGREFSYEADSRLDHFDLATFLGGGLATDLSGRLRIEDPGGDARFQLDLDEPGTIDRYSFARAEGELGLRGDSLAFHSLEAWDEGLAVRLTGVLRPDADSLDLQLRGSSESALLAGHFAGDSTLTGHVEVEGRFSGPIESPAMDLTGEFADARYLDSDFARGHFDLHSAALERAPLAIGVRGEGFVWQGLDFADYYLDASLVGDTLALHHGSLSGTDRAVVFGGALDMGRVPPRLTLDRAWLSWLGEEWLNDRGFEVVVGDSLALGPVAWRSELGSVAILWNRPELGVDAVRVEALDLDQLEPWLPARLGLAGRLSGTLRRDVLGTLRCSARLDSMRLGGEPAGWAQLDLRWRGDSLTVDSLRWELEPGRELRLAGGLAGLPSADRAPGSLAELSVDSLRLDLALAAERFPLERIAGLWEASAFLAGDFTGGVELGGRPDEPVLTSRGRVDSCRLGHVEFARVDWTARQQDQVLRLGQFDVRRGRSRVGGWAELPLRLAFGRAPGLRPQGELHGEIEVTAEGADLLGVTDLFAEAAGQIRGTLRLAGKPGRPTPSGALRLRDGVLRLSGWEERLEDLDVDAELRADTLQILSLHARERIQWSRLAEGELSGEGWLTWFGPFRYGMSLDVRRGSFGTLPFFTGLLSGELQLSTWEQEGVPPHPYLVGDLDIHEGVLSYTFDDIGEAPGATVAPILSYDLDVRAEQNLQLINDEANLELSGDLHLSNTPTGQDISGELQTLRGHYLVFGNKFHLVEGKLDFSSAEGINPKIDILAETRNRDDKIRILITNTFAEPEVDVLSEQGYSREDVLRILAGLPVSGGGEAAGTVVVGRVEAELINRLERMVSGELVGLVDFGLENRNLEEAGGVETRWQIGRYLPGGLYISYNQGLSLDSDREVALEYRLYNRLYLRSEIVNRGGQFAEEGLINEYNFDLRLRHEY